MSTFQYTNHWYRNFRSLIDVFEAMKTNLISKYVFIAFYTQFSMRYKAVDPFMYESPCWSKVFNPDTTGTFPCAICKKEESKAA